MSLSWIALRPLGCSLDGNVSSNRCLLIGLSPSKVTRDRRGGARSKLLDRRRSQLYGLRRGGVVDLLSLWLLLWPQAFQMTLRRCFAAALSRPMLLLDIIAPLVPLGSEPFSPRAACGLKAMRWARSAASCRALCVPVGPPRSGDGCYGPRSDVAWDARRMSIWPW